MISSFSALVERAFVVGFVVPTLVLFAALSLLFPGIPPFDKADAVLAGKADAGGIAYALIVLWLAALGVSLLNTPIYRMLEGYYWPVTRFPRWLRRERVRRAALEARYDAARAIAIGAAAARGGASPGTAPRDRDKVLVEAQTLLQRLKDDFPIPDGKLMPTRLGNVLRAFERYPNEIYGADGVTLWPLLVTVMPADSRTAVDNAKSSSDLCLNLCVFSAAFALLSLYRAVAAAPFWPELCDAGCWIALEPLPQDWWASVGFLVLAASSLGLSYCFYRVTIAMARNWGRQVRAAFDVYLGAVAEKLGSTVPQQPDERRKFWTAVSQQVLYFEPLPPRAAVPDPAEQAKPVGSGQAGAPRQTGG